MMMNDDEAAEGDCVTSDDFYIANCGGVGYTGEAIIRSLDFVVNMTDKKAAVTAAI